MAKYARRRKSVRPFRAMRKARMYRSVGLRSFGTTVGRFIGRKISNAVHTFRKEVQMPALFETSADQHLAYQFTANQLPEWPQFQEIYDQYMIKKVVLTFEPQWSGSNTNAVAPFQRWIRIVHDYDDATPLAAETDYLEYTNCKSRLASQPRTIRTVLYPKVLKPAYILGGSFQTQPAKSGWLDTDSYTVPHLGLKVFTPTLGLTNGYVMYRVRATFILKFKNSR